MLTIERYAKCWKELDAYYEKGVNDGIKEFAERLKEEIDDYIDNLVKEMTEGNEV